MKLLLDAMCGGLRASLRLCGHDTAYALDRGIEDDDRLRVLARREDRTLVTRDRELAARTERSVLLTAREVDDQLRELAEAGIPLDVADDPAFCGRCNGSLDAMAETDSTPAYAPDPADQRVWRCVDCGQCFWKGSHWRAMRDRLAAVPREGG